MGRNTANGMISSIQNYGFFHQLKNLPFVQAIWLYGSRARGDHTDRSDIDLAIVCPSASSKEWLVLLDKIDEADTLLKIDCVRFDVLSEKNPLRAAILKDKIVLFERSLKMHSEWNEVFVMLGDVLKRFEEMVHEPENRTSYVQDATIYRFEFCVELFWKVLKKIAESEGYQVRACHEITYTTFLWINSVIPITMEMVTY